MAELEALQDVPLFVQTTILNAWIPPRTDYFVEQPHGLENSSGMGFKLRKALYGLRRSLLYLRAYVCLDWYGPLEQDGHWG
jgi:hypothetical protein